MKNVTDSEQNVKGQKQLIALERASWILGIGANLRVFHMMRQPWFAGGGARVLFW